MLREWYVSLIYYQYSHYSNPTVYWSVIVPPAVGAQCTNTRLLWEETLTKLSVCSGDDITSIQQEITMMKECKHKNIVAYFGSYHRYCVFSACPLQMCGSAGIVGGLKYVEFDFSYPHTAAGFLSHSSSAQLDCWHSSSWMTLLYLWALI